MGLKTDYLSSLNTSHTRIIFRVEVLVYFLLLFITYSNNTFELSSSSSYSFSPLTTKQDKNKREDRCFSFFFFFFFLCAQSRVDLNRVGIPTLLVYQDQLIYECQARLSIFRN